MSNPSDGLQKVLQFGQLYFASMMNKNQETGIFFAMMVVVYTNLQATSVILYANRLHFNIVTFIIRKLMKD